MLSVKGEPEEIPTWEEGRIIQEGYTRCSENTEGIDGNNLQVTVHMDDEGDDGDDILEEKSENGIPDHAADEEPSQKILPQPSVPTLPVRGTDVEMTQAHVSSLQDERPRETYPGLLQNTSNSEDTCRPEAITFGDEFGFLMKSLLDRFEYERGQETMTLKRVFQDLTDKLIQENISLRRDVQDVKEKLNKLERKFAVTRQTSGTKKHLCERVCAGKIKTHAKARVKSSQKSCPHTTNVGDRCSSASSQSQQARVKSSQKRGPHTTNVGDRCSSSKSQQGMVELMPGSGVHVKPYQMMMLELHAATKSARQVLRIGLLELFTKDELMNGCAVGLRMAHNKGTHVRSTPLDPVKLMTLKEFVLKKFKRDDMRPALQDKEMNRIVNCKCSELRRVSQNA